MNKKNEKTAASKETAMDIEPLEAPQIATDVVKPLDLSKILRENLTLLLRAIELDDRNLVRRVWRRNTCLRKSLSILDFQDILLAVLPSGPVRNKILEGVDLLLRTTPSSKTSGSKTKVGTENLFEEPLMEVECYLALLVASKLVNSGEEEESKLEYVVSLCRFEIERLKSEKRQTLDSFNAKLYFYLALSSEKLRKLANRQSASSEELLTELTGGHRTACLRLYEHSQATLSNAILRLLIEEKLISKATVFSSQTAFPLESANVPNSEQVRYLFYTAKIAAIEGEYGKANELSTRAVRKTPTPPNSGGNVVDVNKRAQKNGTSNSVQEAEKGDEEEERRQRVYLGFRLSVRKLNLVVKLLMGEIPERGIFEERFLKKELNAYFHLTRAVRDGSVENYNAVIAKYETIFLRDETLSLVSRLRSSVIKTGLRNISVAYSRISFEDIRQKLNLSSEKDAELLCSKALKEDILLENTILDSENKCLLSKNTDNAYETSTEPSEEFDKRVNFLFGVYNTAKKGLKFGLNNASDKQGGNKGGPGNKEQKDDLEIKDIIEDADFDDFLE